LQSANTVTGLWVNVSNTAQTNRYVVTPAGAIQFYRMKQ
jgi:hypothetical protein